MVYRIAMLPKHHNTILSLRSIHEIILDNLAYQATPNLVGPGSFPRIEPKMKASP